MVQYLHFRILEFPLIMGLWVVTDINGKMEWADSDDSYG